METIDNLYLKVPSAGILFLGYVPMKYILEYIYEGINNLHKDY